MEDVPRRGVGGAAEHGLVPHLEGVERPIRQDCAWKDDEHRRQNTRSRCDSRWGPRDRSGDCPPTPAKPPPGRSTRQRPAPSAGCWPSSDMARSSEEPWIRPPDSQAPRWLPTAAPVKVPSSRLDTASGTTPAMHSANTPAPASRVHRWVCRVNMVIAPPFLRPAGALVKVRRSGIGRPVRPPRGEPVSASRGQFPGSLPAHFCPPGCEYSLRLGLDRLLEPEQSPWSRVEKFSTIDISRMECLNRTRAVRPAAAPPSPRHSVRVEGDNVSRSAITWTARAWPGVWWVSRSWSR